MGKRSVGVCCVSQFESRLLHGDFLGNPLEGFVVNLKGRVVGEEGFFVTGKCRGSSLFRCVCTSGKRERGRVLETLGGSMCCFATFS